MLPAHTNEPNSYQIGFAKMLLHYAKFSKDERPAMYTRVKKEFGDVVGDGSMSGKISIPLRGSMIIV